MFRTIQFIFPALVLMAMNAFAQEPGKRLNLDLPKLFECNTPACTNLIKQISNNFESCRKNPYYCPGGDRGSGEFDAALYLKSIEKMASHYKTSFNRESGPIYTDPVTIGVFAKDAQSALISTIQKMSKEKVKEFCNANKEQCAALFLLGAIGDCASGGCSTKFKCWDPPPASNGVGGIFSCHIGVDGKGNPKFGIQFVMQDRTPGPATNSIHKDGESIPASDFKDPKTGSERYCGAFTYKVNVQTEPCVPTNPQSLLLNPQSLVPNPHKILPVNV